MKCRSKSRAGCRTCKIKRLKCGEETPHCRNCVSRGVSCPGYQKDLKWSTKYENRRGSATTAEPVEFEQLASAASESILAQAAPQMQEKKPSTTNTPAFSYTQDGDSTLDHTPSSPALLTSNTSTFHVETGRRQGSEAELASQHDDNLIISPKLLTKYPDPAEINHANDHRQVSQSPPNLCQSLTQPSTRLVELWFKSVCGVWSAFDSPANPFRRLCSSLWGSSEVVFYSLQSMASTSLVIDSPGVKEIAALAPRRANQALIKELQALFQAPNSVSSVPAGLLISLFCMSSSCSWVDARELGLQYLGNARLVLDLLELNMHSLHQEDRQLLGFFRGCLVYEQMLRGIVSNREEDLSALLEWNAIDPVLDPLGLHPWTGVSTGIVMLLGKSIALCRKSRDLWRHRPIATYTRMLQALHDISEGQRLEERLLSIEVPTESEEASDIKSEKHSLRTDLYHATEAFRLSSLLQLYQSFPDLLSRRLPGTEAGGAHVPQSQWVTGLAVRISKILEEIPASSPMRCLQPLICVCAGSGLRHDTADVPLSITEHDTAQDLKPFSLDVNGLEVSQARGFLLTRLGELEQGILSNSVVVARQLLLAIWSAFDQDTALEQSHWMDVMAGTKSWTVFG
ncbi:fungal-specific transcription factor domain-containing protein [Dactylonectria macrodidyma]|uniref:Fungal-specific transcription factor domain-containing protein n=1 Tax=Dactylonectria macrodidyma TaxID=307937 RepID=A0A9P9F3X9_9HYPO|nr:fungal-specific transcription factor domain-containing protein [Dactylonectria macrodidyma]